MISNNATNSVASINRASSLITTLTTYMMTATEKDSSGNNIGHAGDTFLILISDWCTNQDSFNCNIVAGTKSTVQFTYAEITDNGDETYN